MLTYEERETCSTTRPPWRTSYVSIRQHTSAYERETCSTTRPPWRTLNFSPIPPITAAGAAEGGGVTEVPCVEVVTEVGSVTEAGSGSGRGVDASLAITLGEPAAEFI
jgi:hypothetical protein